MMPNGRIELLIEEHIPMVNKIIRQKYFGSPKDVQDELLQCGLIGVWEAVRIYYKNGDCEFVRERFYRLARKYAMWRISGYFRTQTSGITLSSRDWDLRSKVHKLSQSTLPDDLPCMLASEGLNYGRYLEIERVLSTQSLDQKTDEGGTNDVFNCIPCQDAGIKTFIEQDYVSYIVETALSHTKRERDKQIICSWLEMVLNGETPNKRAISRMYGVSESIVGTTVFRFIDICRKMRDD